MRAGSASSCASLRSISASAAGASRNPERVAVRLHLVVRSAGLDARRVILGVPASDGVSILLVDEEPLLALVVLEGTPAGVIGAAPCIAAAAARAHDREATTDLLAIEAELQLSVANRRGGVGRFGLRLERAPIPHDDVARTVLARRDDALEVEVLEGMVLDMDRHPPLIRIEARATRHCPADQHAVDLQPHVVVQARRAMALDDESATGRCRLRGAGGSAPAGATIKRTVGFGRLLEVPFAAIFLEGHRRSVWRAPASDAKRRARNGRGGARSDAQADLRFRAGRVSASSSFVAALRDGRLRRLRRLRGLGLLGGLGIGDGHRIAAGRRTAPPSRR